MTTLAPINAPCHRCHQPRPLYPYKPIHDCVDQPGVFNLPEAVARIADMHESGDIWCLARLTRTPRLLCTPCHAKDFADETRSLQEYERWPVDSEDAGYRYLYSSVITWLGNSDHDLAARTALAQTLGVDIADEHPVLHAAITALTGSTSAGQLAS